MNIVLTGFMGTGKTAVGKKLAENLDKKYADIDELIEKKQGMKIPEIFIKHGEKHFRDIETQVINEVAQNDNYIIATGGGAVLREENMAVLEKNGFIVNLSASPEVIYKRTKNSKNRPLLNKPEPMKEILELLELRKPFYSRCNISINTDTLDVDAIVNKIIEETNKE